MKHTRLWYFACELQVIRRRFRMCDSCALLARQDLTRLILCAWVTWRARRDLCRRMLSDVRAGFYLRTCRTLITCWSAFWTGRADDVSEDAFTGYLEDRRWSL